MREGRRNAKAKRQWWQLQSDRYQPTACLLLPFYRGLALLHLTSSPARTDTPPHFPTHTLVGVELVREACALACLKVCLLVIRRCLQRQQLLALLLVVAALHGLITICSVSGAVGLQGAQGEREGGGKARVRGGGVDCQGRGR